MKGIGNLSLDENSEWEKKNSKIKKNIYISVPSKVRKGEGETKNLRKMLVSQRQNKWNKHMEPIANYNRWHKDVSDTWELPHDGGICRLARKLLS